MYATAWENKEQLEAYNTKQEEAKRRDHRAIGRALDLFSIQEDAGGGLVFWHAKGSVIRRLIEDYWKEKHLEVFFSYMFLIIKRCIIFFKIGILKLVFRMVINCCTRHTLPA